MKEFNHLPELITYLWEEDIAKNNTRIYFDPFPKHFDFDQNENPPSYYCSMTPEDEMNVPTSALLLGIGYHGFVEFLIEKFLVTYYKEHKKDVKGNQISTKN
jgi:hypothetical protein